MNRPHRHITMTALACLMTLLTACRRDLWVYGDEFTSVSLDVDWREYQSSDPDGMTCWFFPDNEDIMPSSITTASVRHTNLYLGHGHYTGVVIDYSPQEYSRQEFLGMDRKSTARVQMTPASYQPDDSTLTELYGPLCYHEPLPVTIPETGYYQVMNQPEQMALDTLQDMVIHSGEYGDYIPYKERDTYQSTLTMQQFYSIPTSPVWNMRIRIFIRGFDYLWQAEGSLAGLADGRFLALNHNTDVPCLLSLTEWDMQRTGNNTGYISINVANFGLRGSQHPARCYDDYGHDITPDDARSETPLLSRQRQAVTRARAGNQINWDDTRTVNNDDIRLNLKFILRDHSTVLLYHFDVGEYVVSYDNQLVLRLDLGPDFPDIPDLPYVDAYEGTGFDATVTPWQDGGMADVPM